MFRPAPIFIGLRYIRAKRRNQLVSLISLISMLGVALGMVVLITILSVLNGFDREIKKSIFSMISPITVSSLMGEIDNWPVIDQMVIKTPGVVAAAPYLQGLGLLQSAGLIQPILVIGILPEKEKKISALSEKLIQGELSSLKPNHYQILVDEDLAASLKVKVGDLVTMTTTQEFTSASQIIPRLGFTQFTVAGILRANGGGFASKLAYIHLNDAQKIFKRGSSVTALHVNIESLYAAPVIAHQIEQRMPSIIRVNHWMQQLGDYFQMINSTKTMMFFIFLLIIIVAIFNLISTLVMVVKNKAADIAILRTMGATPGMVMTVFVVQGAAIGLGGTLLGVMGGVELAWHITGIVNWIQDFFHVQLISSSVYFVNYLPSELQWADVAKISTVSFGLSLIATLYPAWNAARTEPAAALRYE